MVITAIAYCVGFALFDFVTLVIIILTGLFHFLGVGALVATAFWWFANHHLVAPPSPHQ
jgi:hypothetical protein